MAINARKGMRLATLALALGVLAWSLWRAPRDAAASALRPAPTAAPAAPAAWKIGKLTLTACELPKPHSGLSTAAWCGSLAVPENRADPHGRTITLKLALLRAGAQVASPDLVAFLAGGPGQAATDAADTVHAALRPLLAHRHVLLLDQRGTGGSNALACRDGNDDATDASDFDARKVAAAASECLRQLRSHADPRYYTTSIAVQDLEDVRQALGAPPLDLIGVSYGTRVAQQYARRYPQAVRSIVLDSPVPNPLALGQDFARNLDDALHAQFARCSAQPACRKAFGDPGQTLYQLRDALRANPHWVNFRDPQSYRSVKRLLDEGALANVVRMFAYTPATAALLPLSIDAAAHGDVGPLLGQARILSGDLSELMGSGMQYSVICAEDADRLVPRVQDADSILGTRMVDVLKAVCSVWPKGARPDDFHAPLRTDKPVLLLAGQYDPVTPPRYAQAIASHLGNARVLVLNGQAHSVMSAGCAPRLIRDFVEQLQPKTLDATCLDRLQPTPIFIDFNGATP
jgi:pimeloyl-ACP methyl ester carboxylesterase